MSNWDDEAFDLPEPVVAVKTQWDDEDADDSNVKDNWDDDDEQQKKETNETTTVAVPKKKKTLKEKIAEREEKQREAVKQKIQETATELTPEEKAAKKADEQRAVEEADLENIEDTFGVSKNNIYSMKPKTADEFYDFSQAIVERVTAFEDSPHYPAVLEHIYRNCCLDVDATEIKKLASVLNAVASEKLKIAKGKGKKGKKLGGKSKDTNELYQDTVYDEYDDFM